MHFFLKKKKRNKKPVNLNFLSIFIFFQGTQKNVSTHICHKYGVLVAPWYNTRNNFFNIFIHN